MKKITLAILFLLVSSGLLAQPYDKVSIDLNSTSVKTVTFPFDAQFTMIGKAPENCVRIDFFYKISDKEKDKNHKFKKWISLPVENPDGSYYLSDTWTKKGAETEFSLNCRGMHPDVRYDFMFEEILNVENDAALKADLKQALAVRVQQFAASAAGTGFDQTDLDNLTIDLNKIVKDKLIIDPANQFLRKKSDPKAPYYVDLTIDLKTYTGNALTYSNTIKSKQDDLGSLGKMEANAQAEFTRLIPQIAADVDFVLGDNADLSANSKQLLDIVVTPSIDGFKTYTLRTGLLLLKKMRQNPGQISDLIERKVSIANNDISATPATDASSVDYLAALLKYMHSGRITLVAGTEKFDYLTLLNQYMTKAASDVDEIVDKKKKLNDLLATFPDLTTGIVIALSLTADVVTVSDVSTAATPYISLDAGLGYASTLGAGYSYVGANFYFAPVNKKALLGRMKGWNWVKKFACLSVGYATYYGDRAPHTYSILGGDGKSDVMVGLGLRLTRVLKANLNTVPYLVSSNPLTTDKSFRLGFSAGIGLDINLLGALGDTFTKGLKISK